jgi:hypothetical protein
MAVNVVITTVKKLNKLLSGRIIFSQFGRM